MYEHNIRINIIDDNNIDTHICFTTYTTSNISFDDSTGDIGQLLKYLSGVRSVTGSIAEQIPIFACSADSESIYIDGVSPFGESASAQFGVGNIDSINDFVVKIS